MAYRNQAVVVDLLQLLNLKQETDVGAAVAATVSQHGCSQASLFLRSSVLARSWLRASMRSNPARNTRSATAAQQVFLLQGEA
jgi:hypothetical protein